MNTANQSVFKKVSEVNTANIRPIADYLNDQKAILDNLLKIINDEFDALRDRQIDSLKPLAEEKSHLMVKLQSNDQCLKLHPDVALLKTDYKDDVAEIKRMMKNCHFRNEVNGKLIKLCMQATNKLQALFVNVRDGITRNMTYNNKGNAMASGPSRLSVVA